MLCNKCSLKTVNVFIKEFSKINSIKIKITNKKDN